MKLKDIDIPTECIMMVLYALWFFVAINTFMLVLTIIKAIALYFFNYQIVLFGINL